jgi:ribokinase
MIGRVGSDPHGEQLIQGLEEDGVDVSGVARDQDWPSGAALILVEKDGQNMIAVAPGANGSAGESEVAALLRGLQRSDVVVLQLEVPLPTVAAAAAAAKGVGATVLLNAAPSTTLRGDVLPQSDVLVVNETEASDLAGIQVTDAGTGALAAQHLAAHARSIVVTMGEAGAIVWASGVATTAPPFAVEAVDATAAGDAFVGAVALGLAAGWSLLEAVRLGSAAGAGAAASRGARSSLPRAADLERLVGYKLDLSRMST